MQGFPKQENYLKDYTRVKKLRNTKLGICLLGGILDR